jgi:Zn-dependent protease with chaperone function
LRTVALVNVQRRMREAHAKFGDIEISDWLMGIVLPFLCYLGLVAAGAGFLTLKAAAFDVLAVVIICVLLLGVFGAWELMIWLALTRLRAKDLGE